MRVVLVGNRRLAKHVLRYLSERDWDIVGSVMPEGKMADRQAGFESFEDLSEEKDFELIRTEDINSVETRREIEDLNPDLCICPGWSQIINQSVLDIPKKGFIGFHSGKLPAERGGAPVNWSIIDGAEEIWITLFFYDTGVDSGDIISQKPVKVERRDDVSTIFEKLSITACNMLSENRENLKKGREIGRSQDISQATYRPRRKPEDGIIDWSQDSEEIYDWVRAQTKPYPGAYTFYDQNKLKIWKGEPTERKSGQEISQADNGEILEIVDGEGIDVKCGKGAFRVQRVQMEGKPEMWADNFAKKYSIETGEKLGRTQYPENWLHTQIGKISSGNYKFGTNVERGTEAKVSAVLESPNSAQNIKVNWHIDGEKVKSKQVKAEGIKNTCLKFTPEEKRTYSIRVDFLKDGERIDRRYLKIFSH